MEEGRVVTGRNGAVPHLRLKRVCKAYGATQALSGASFDVPRGAIHALVGGNGSGKSTLIKIMAGVVSADAGELELAGTTRDLRSHTAARAREIGLHVVHQQNATFPALTVAENLSIGRGFESGLAGRIRWRAVRRRAERVLERFDIAASPDDRLDRLSPANQMMVAIARALQDQDHTTDAILALDEPTAGLPKHEVDLLLDALRRYAARGATILYVTHRLEEVMRVAQTGTVLRDGQVVDSFRPGRTSHDDLVTLIMGRPVTRATRERRLRATAPEVMLRAEGFGRGDVRLELRAGEVLGVAGILGSGRSTLLRQVFGVVDAPGAKLELAGEPVTLRRPQDAIRAGIAYVPEDRLREGMFAELSVSQNLSIAALSSHAWAGVVSSRSERRGAQSLIERFHVTTQSEHKPLGSLSGGNQQKVMLARWMQRDPRVILLDEPTQGIDAGARAEIHRLVRHAVDRGAATMMVSSDFEELAAESDRVIVLQEGRAVAELAGEDVDEATINALVYAKEAA